MVIYCMAYDVGSRRLDRLYARNTRCPYCKAAIRKMTSTCERCGVTKKQIESASWQDARAIQKGKKTGKIVKTKLVPKDMDYGRWLIVLVLLGWTGYHNFWVGRRLRGWILCGMMLTFILCLIIFPPGSPLNDMAGMSEARKWFAERAMVFPSDVIGGLVVVMWLIDWGAVVLFRTFKYPVHMRVETSTESLKSDPLTKQFMKREKS